jgi:hypothetical protein
VIGSFDEIVPFFAAGSRASLRTTLEPRTTEEFVGSDRTFSGYVAVPETNMTKNLDWHSSDDSVVAVSRDRQVEARKDGFAELPCAMKE